MPDVGIAAQYGDAFGTRRKLRSCRLTFKVVIHRRQAVGDYWRVCVRFFQIRPGKVTDVVELRDQWNNRALATCGAAILPSGRPR
jgi:hypothetical protein